MTPTPYRKPHNQVRLVTLTAFALAFASFTTALRAQTAPAVEQPADKKAVKLETFVTLGSRFKDRTVAESPVPIDIVTSDDLHNNGYTELAQNLSVIIPSLDFPRPANTDGTDTVRPATLRGLGPGETLVLLNGKRFHQSALVNLNGSVGKGDAAVDLNSIPSFALGGAEVLRDGAAAQYGSDAIAGIINLHLRQDTGFSTEATVGQFYAGDGATISGSGNYGIALKQGGFVNVTATFRDSGYTDRSGPDLRQQYFGTNATTGKLVAPASTSLAVNGVADSRETFDLHDSRFGDPVSHSRGLFFNAELPLGGGIDFYAFGGVNTRHSFSYASWRRPADSTNVRAIYPNGFQPQINPHVQDASLTAGLSGVLAGWKWDLSETYGQNNLFYYTVNSVNVSYGTASPTRFYDGELSFRQATTNLDLTREFETGLSAPLKTAVGLEYRHDNYVIKQGDTASWANGGITVLDGPSTGSTPSFGAQGFPGFRPVDATDSSRENIAGYVDVENQVTKRLNLDVAGRAEHYSDAGSTETGKLSALYKLTDWLNARASFSNGFRAPQLQQEYFTTTSSVILTVNGVTGPYDVKTFQVNSPAAVALGATPLKPEQSTNFSGGFSATPLPGLTASVDYYNIGITNRIVLSSSFATTSVANYLTTQGYPGIEGGRYFTNGIDTRTQGVDVTTSYDLKLRNGDKLTLTGGFNYNDTTVTYAKSTPAKVLSLTTNQPIFDRQAILRFERGTPLDKFAFSANYDLGKRFSFLVRETWYGKVLSAGAWTTANPAATPGAVATDQWLGAKWLTDVELAWHLTHNLTVAVGANNVFNVYPDKFDAANNTTGLSQYSSFSPFGFNGGFWYTRVSARF